MSVIDARLKTLGITLSAPPAPVAAYVPFTKSGNLVFISGQVPLAIARGNAYAQIVTQGDDPEFVRAIRDATNGGLALVDPALKSRLEAQSGRRLEHKKPGPVPASDRPSLDGQTLELAF